MAHALLAPDLARLPSGPTELARAGRDPRAVFAEQRREPGFIRPSTRTAIRAPTIPPGAPLPLPSQTVPASGQEKSE
jgi:hypothetical protein